MTTTDKEVDLNLQKSHISKKKEKKNKKSKDKEALKSQRDIETNADIIELNSNSKTDSKKKKRKRKDEKVKKSKKAKRHREEVSQNSEPVCIDIIHSLVGELEGNADSSRVPEESVAEDQEKKERKKSAYQKIYKEQAKEFELNELKDVLPFMKVSKVKLELDQRATSSKWRSRKSNVTGKEETTFNSGMFSLIERERVATAIQEYLVDYGLSKEDLPYLIRPKLKTPTGGSNPFTEHHGFSARIRERAKVNRSIAQVYFYLIKSYSEYKVAGDPRTEWSPEDDERLKKYIQLKGVGKWTEIERLLGRDGAKVKHFD
jgi:hypothetical protein